MAADQYFLLASNLSFKRCGYAFSVKEGDNTTTKIATACHDT